MELTSRKAVRDGMMKYGFVAPDMTVHEFVEDELPSVPAVPLDKLCEWLNVHCGRPNYCNDRLCGECNLDGKGFEYETCWKTLLTEWMEEQDAQTDQPGK